MGLLTCRTVAPSEPDWVGRVPRPTFPAPAGLQALARLEIPVWQGRRWWGSGRGQNLYFR